MHRLAWLIPVAWFVFAGAMFWLGNMVWRAIELQVGGPMP